jgi:hypothetical protein
MVGFLDGKTMVQKPEKTSALTVYRTLEDNMMMTNNIEINR